MGYRSGRRAGQQAGIDHESRDLPVFNIAGTDFTVDIAKHEFRQANDPYNRISLGNVKEEMGFSHFLYDTQTKNLYIGIEDPGQLPMHVHIIIVPPLKDLDPVGLARRHGMPDDFYGRLKKQAVKLTAISRTGSNQQQVKGNEKKAKRRKGRKKSV